MAAPLYNRDNDVYLKESAAVGFLERVRIQHVTQTPSGGWAYGIIQEPGQPNAIPTVNDQMQHIQRRQVYYGESELITYCAALTLAKAYFERQLAKIETMLAVCT